jgi:hypothetical protein
MKEKEKKEEREEKRKECEIETKVEPHSKMKRQEEPRKERKNGVKCEGEEWKPLQKSSQRVASQSNANIKRRRTRRHHPWKWLGQSPRQHQEEENKKITQHPLGRVPLNIKKTKETRGHLAQLLNLLLAPTHILVGHVWLLLHGHHGDGGIDAWGERNLESHHC